MKLKAQAVRIGGPADATGKIVAAGSLDRQRPSVPVSLNLNPERIIGEARIYPDGKADITLREGFEFKPDTHDFAIGYKVLKSHKDGDVNVIDELDVLTLGIVRKVSHTYRLDGACPACAKDGTVHGCLYAGREIKGGRLGIASVEGMEALNDEVTGADAQHEHVFNAYNVIKHSFECSTCHKTKEELAKA